MPTPPRRRWLQFGLRGLLVGVTVLAVFAAYYGNWIRHRHAIIDGDNWAAYEGDPLPHAPGLLWAFGQKGYLIMRRAILVNDPDDPSERPEGIDEELQAVHRLFPEATIDVVLQAKGGGPPFAGPYPLYPDIEPSHRYTARDPE